ncbi:DUF5068 domain-containing protein [Bacillus kwashiorkori]|uniref:DUF5068 domain-containing protein n=1 Tax=Bacillus kwashiorkori TaxID=1522318 RepID=UPI000784BBC0|nr:DUF5068 domain-containing protein [Bacillus kwashiorkori]
MKRWDSKRKSLLLVSFLLAVMLVIAGCGKKEETAKKDNQENEKKVEQTDESAKDDDKDKDENQSDDDKQNEGTSPANGEELNPYIAEDTEGDVEIIFSNNQPNIQHDMGGFQLTIDAYQVVKVTDIHERSTISFDGDREGYIVTAKVSINNQSGGDYFFNTMSMGIQGTNPYDSKYGSTSFVKQGEELRAKGERPGQYANGEQVTGFITFKYTVAEFEEILKISPKFVIQAGSDNEQFKGKVGENGTFEFPLSEEGIKKAAEAQAFFQDSISLENIAEKTMIYEEKNIGTSKKIGDVTIKLDGVQFTDIEPTEANKPSFRNFGDKGVVALTVKLTIDNKSQDTIGYFFTNGTLIVDENRYRVLSTSQLEPDTQRELKPGESNEKLFVFLFRKDEFSIFEKFDLEIGPLRDSDGKDLQKGRKVEFEIPYKK